MLDVLLHAGTEHVNLWWVFIPALVAFAGGLAIGLWSRRAGSDASETGETPETSGSSADGSETHYNHGEN